MLTCHSIFPNDKNTFRKEVATEMFSWRSSQNPYLVQLRVVPPMFDATFQSFRPHVQSTLPPAFVQTFSDLAPQEVF